MSQKHPNENIFSRKWREIMNTLERFRREESAIGRGSPAVRLVFLLMLIVVLFLCLLIFSSDLLSFNIDLIGRVQNVRLTIQPFTPTYTTTPTRKATHTLTPTVTLTPTGKLPTATITPTLFTPTFTVTSTPTKPAVSLQTLQPDEYYEWKERLTNDWLWRHILSITAGIFLATWLVVLYIRDVYGIRRTVQSANLLTRMLLLMPIGTIRVKGGNLVDERGRIVRKDWILVTPEGKIVRKNDQPVMAKGIQRTLRLLRIGIPARLIVEKDSCVVVEGSQKQSLVIGPTRGAAVLLGFSRIRRMVDLRDAAIKISLNQPTSDGVLLIVEEAEFIFGVDRNNPTVPGARYLYNEGAIFNLVYRYWLDGEWLPEMKTRITAELRQYITERPLSEFMPYLSQDETLPVNPNQPKNPFHTFVAAFNAKEVDDPNLKQRSRGIKIRWHGEGKLKLPRETDLTEQLEKWQVDLDNLLKLPEQFSSQPTGGEYNEDLMELIREVPLELLDQVLPPNVVSTMAMLKIIEAYRDKLNEVTILYQQYGQVPPKELVETIEHLNRLILRRIGGAG